MGKRVWYNRHKTINHSIPQLFQRRDAGEVKEMRCPVLTRRTIIGRALCIIFLSFVALSSFRPNGADADVRRYFWITIPTWPPKQEITQNVDYLCNSSKSDMSRYSDSAVDGFVEKCRNTDAAILYYHNSFGQTELNAIRLRLAQCQSVFAEEQHKRRVRSKRGLQEDRTPAQAK